MKAFIFFWKTNFVQRCKTNLTRSHKQGQAKSSNHKEMESEWINMMCNN